MLRFWFSPALFCFLAVLASVPRSSTAGDWPQIMGLNRNGIAAGEKLAGTWPAAGPKTLWKRDVGSGFSGVVVADGIAVLFHRVGNNEIAEGMNAASGEVLWTAKFPCDYIPSYTSDNGPRATPLIHKGRVYLHGVKGMLYCVELKSGKKRWSRDPFGDYSSKKPYRGEPPDGYFGIAATPIVADGKLLLNVGGDANNAGIVAFSLDSGKTVWKATAERASYSSPVAATINGAQHVIFAARFNIISVDPKGGKTRFRIPFGKPGPNVTASIPTIIGNRLFVTASYEFGAVYAAIGKNDAKILWSSDEILSSQYTTCVADGDYLYGIHGRQDQGRAALRCFNPATKKIAWTKENFGYATFLKADGKLVLLKSDGELVLVEATVKRYRELARATVFTDTIRVETRALPALSDGRLFIRDKHTLKCLDLSKPN